MDDENDTSESGANPAGNVTTPDPLANGAETQPQIGVISQYIKDLSVENPNAPDVYQWNAQPQIDVQFNIGSSQVSDEVHEVDF